MLRLCPLVCPHARQGPHVLAVEMQGVDIFEALSVVRVQGGQPNGESEEDEGSGTSSRDRGVYSSASDMD